MSLAVITADRSPAGRAVTVEVHLANGLPSFTLVGLADTEVKEARERAAALQNSRLEFPHNKRITVNLAPADLPRSQGASTCRSRSASWRRTGRSTRRQLEAFEFAGELSLAGELRPSAARWRSPWR